MERGIIGLQVKLQKNNSDLVEFVSCGTMRTGVDWKVRRGGISLSYFPLKPKFGVLLMTNIYLHTQVVSSQNFAGGT